MSQNLQNFVNFQKFQLVNLVDFEKCCKTRIFLQKSVPIQPKTSNILPMLLVFGSQDGPGRERPQREEEVLRGLGVRHPRLGLGPGSGALRSAARPRESCRKVRNWQN